MITGTQMDFSLTQEQQGKADASGLRLNAHDCGGDRLPDRG
jgi:hypothetical protein